jgi:hypothetical protein
MALVDQLDRARQGDGGVVRVVPLRGTGAATLEEALPMLTAQRVRFNRSTPASSSANDVAAQSQNRNNRGGQSAIGSPSGGVPGTSNPFDSSDDFGGQAGPQAPGGFGAGGLPPGFGGNQAGAQAPGGSVTGGPAQNASSGPMRSQTRNAGSAPTGGRGRSATQSGSPAGSAGPAAGGSSLPSAAAAGPP